MFYMFSTCIYVTIIDIIVSYSLSVCVFCFVCCCLYLFLYVFVVVLGVISACTVMLLSGAWVTYFFKKILHLNLYLKLA